MTVSFILLFPIKINHIGEQKVSGFRWRLLVSWVHVLLLYPLFISFFYVPLYFSIPRRFLWYFFLLCLWFIPFNFIIFFSPFFHLISSRTNTNSSHLESPHPVVLFLILSVCVLSLTQVKATFTTPLQSESSCRCCSRQDTAADCACQGIYRSCTHPRFAGLTPTPARAHAPHTSTRCPCWCAGVSLCCVISPFLMLPYVFLCSGWEGCKLENAERRENLYLYSEDICLVCSAVLLRIINRSTSSWIMPPSQTSWVWPSWVNECLCKSWI